VQAIIDLSLSGALPLRPVLCRTALGVARRKLEFMRKEFDATKSTTVGSDFPIA
jgi:hypothetical protein